MIQNIYVLLATFLPEDLGGLGFDVFVIRFFYGCKPPILCCFLTASLWSLGEFAVLQTLLHFLQNPTKTLKKPQMNYESVYRVDGDDGDGVWWIFRVSDVQNPKYLTVHVERGVYMCCG